MAREYLYAIHCLAQWMALLCLFSVPGSFHALLNQKYKREQFKGTKIWVYFQKYNLPRVWGTLSNICLLRGSSNMRLKIVTLQGMLHDFEVACASWIGTNHSPQYHYAISKTILLCVCVCARLRCMKSFCNKKIAAHKAQTRGHL